MISVVIPVRAGGSPEITLRSLAAQTFTDFEVIVCRDQDLRGAPWARNRGAEMATGDSILFCDDDVRWIPKALEILVGTLGKHPEASYSYGAYQCGDRVNSDREFDAAALRRMNFVSTMSLVRRSDHPGWDESIKRLQDWDVWLTMLERGKVGVFCGIKVFETDHRREITYDGSISWQEAEAIVKRKHCL